VDVRSRPQAPGCSIETRVDGDTHLIVVEGELDLAVTPELDRELKRAERGESRQIVLDLQRLTFIDSTGIALLVKATNGAGANADRLRIRRSDAPAVQRILDVTGIDAHLPYTD
jgi:anti-anti-sigma factor